eukprot:1427840-Rhodomonas_salina.1
MLGLKGWTLHSLIIRHWQLSDSTLAHLLIRHGQLLDSTLTHQLETTLVPEATTRLKPQLGLHRQLSWT